MSNDSIAELATAEAERGDGGLAAGRASLSRIAGPWARPYDSQACFDGQRLSGVTSCKLWRMPMRRSLSAHSIDRLFWVLCANAVLLGLILLTLISKDDRATGLASPAFGQSASAQATPVSGVAPGPAVVMPGQLSPNVWGCYLLDNQRQTLCVYEYLHNEGLHLVAARDVRFDRMLKNFNTAPPPAEMEALSQQPQGSARVLQSHSPAPASPEAPRD
jgi:hypothetical protein